MYNLRKNPCGHRAHLVERITKRAAKLTQSISLHIEPHLTLLVCFACKEKFRQFSKRYGSADTAAKLGNMRVTRAAEAGPDGETEFIVKHNHLRSCLCKIDDDLTDLGDKILIGRAYCISRLTSADRTYGGIILGVFRAGKKRST
ncbi:MAG: hypothetical protein J6J02_01085, partial [Oscillospiraceae bacterium]|nr:hypothetical protein [Oscillospiraceae bacterium]